MKYGTAAQAPLRLKLWLCPFHLWLWLRVVHVSWYILGQGLRLSTRLPRPSFFVKLRAETLACEDVLIVIDLQQLVHGMDHDHDHGMGMGMATCFLASRLEFQPNCQTQLYTWRATLQLRARAASPESPTCRGESGRPGFWSSLAWVGLPYRPTQPHTGSVHYFHFHRELQTQTPLRL